MTLRPGSARMNCGRTQPTHREIDKTAAQTERREASRTCRAKGPGRRADRDDRTIACSNHASVTWTGGGIGRRYPEGAALNERRL